MFLCLSLFISWRANRKLLGPDVYLRRFCLEVTFNNQVIPNTAEQHLLIVLLHLFPSDGNNWKLHFLARVAQLKIPPRNPSSGVVQKQELEFLGKGEKNGCQQFWISSSWSPASVPPFVSLYLFFKWLDFCQTMQSCFFFSKSNQISNSLNVLTDLLVYVTKEYFIVLPFQWIAFCLLFCLLPSCFNKPTGPLILFFPLTQPTQRAHGKDGSGTYLAQTRGVLHLVDSPQETGWGRGWGGLQNATEAGGKERWLSNRSRRSMFLLFRRQI